MATTAIPKMTIHSQRAIFARRGGRGLLYLTVVVLAIIFMFPYFWTISSSLKATDELYVYPPKLIPDVPLPGNYPHVFELFEGNFAHWLWNTVVVTFFSVIGLVASSTVVAYSFARLRWPGRDFIFLLTLGTLMLPGEVTIIPQFLLFRHLNWLDTFKPLLVPVYFGGAFDIFLLRQFVQTIPKELDEAAFIDGANRVKILTTIIIPLMKPAIATVAVIHIVWRWSEFFGPLIYINTSEKQLLAVGLRFFEEWGSTVGQGIPQDNYLMAACVMSSAPILVLFFFTQRYFVQGIVMSGLKG